MAESIEIRLPECIAVSDMVESLHAIFGESARLSGDDLEVAAYVHDSPQCLVRINRVPGYDGDEILADDAVFRRLGERSLQMQHFYIRFREIEWPRLALVALAARAAELGDDLWLNWDTDNVMSGSTLRGIVARMPDFDWTKDVDRLDDETRQAVVGAMPIAEGVGGELLTALRMDESAAFEPLLARLLPGIASAQELGDEAHSASLCLISEFDADPRALNDFVTIAARERAAGSSRIFAVGLVGDFLRMSLLRAATGYAGPQRATPIVVLRGGAAEWQGEGELACRRLSALAR